MRDGIYRLHYDTQTLKSTAMVVVNQGVVSGADRYYFMSGICRTKGSRIEGEVSFKRHSERPGPIPESFDLVFDGISGDNFGEFEVHCPAIPIIKGRARFTWLGGSDNG